MTVGLRPARGRWVEGDARFTNLGLALLGCVLLWASRQFGFEMDRYWIGTEAVALVAGSAYLGAVLLVRTQPLDRNSLWVVIWFAVAMHAMTFFTEPMHSSDMYRYVWDGMVQHHGINPYRYVPGDQALSWLREPNQSIYDNINRREYARTIYPPVAQIVFWVATWFDASLDALKMAMLAFEALGAWALGKLLVRMGRPAAEILLLVWCPLLVWEVGSTAHVDAVVLAFISLALLFRWKDRRWRTGFFLGCAVMTKFYPLLLLPALWRRRDWRMPVALLSVILAGYALYARVGRLVFGFMLGGYQKEEGMESGARYFLLEFARTRLGMPELPNGAFYLLCAAVLGGITWWCWRYAAVEGTPVGLDGPVPAFLKGAGALALALMLLFSPHYPWYVIWLVPFLVLSPSLPMFTYVMGLWFGLTTALADPGPKMFLMNERLYAVVALSFAAQWLLWRFPVWHRLCARERLAVGGREVEVAL